MALATLTFAMKLYKADLGFDKVRCSGKGNKKIQERWAELDGDNQARYLDLSRKQLGLGSLDKWMNRRQKAGEETSLAATTPADLGDAESGDSSVESAELISKGNKPDGRAVAAAAALNWDSSALWQQALAAVYAAKGSGRAGGSISDPPIPPSTFEPQLEVGALQVDVPTSPVPSPEPSEGRGGTSHASCGKGRGERRKHRSSRREQRRRRRRSQRSSASSAVGVKHSRGRNSSEDILTQQRRTQAEELLRNIPGSAREEGSSAMTSHEPTPRQGNTAGETSLKPRPPRHSVAVAARALDPRFKAAVSSPYRRLLRPRPNGSAHSLDTILDWAEDDGMYTTDGQATYLLAEDKEKRIGIQLTDAHGTGFANLYVPSGKIVLHGKTRENLLRWLQNKTDVNPELPRKNGRKNEKALRVGNAVPRGPRG